MIQRPQTLFLLAGLICLVCSLFFPIWTHSDNGITKVTLDAFHLVKTNGVEKVEIASVSYELAYIGAIIVACIGLTAFTIFKYNNRPLQVKLGLINNTVICAAILLMTYVGVPKAQALLGTESLGTNGFGMFLPLASILLIMVANRFIKKDEALVKSVDRIR